MIWQWCRQVAPLGWLALALLIVVALVTMAGCGSMFKADADLDAQKQAAFQASLAQCTQAINAGDLAGARVVLSDLDDRAEAFQQERQVQSLGQLLAGAEALMSGDGALAQAAWSRIEDPHLSREVRVKASLIGIDVPLMPIATAEETK